MPSIALLPVSPLFFSFGAADYQAAMCFLVGLQPPECAVEITEISLQGASTVGKWRISQSGRRWTPNTFVQGYYRAARVEFCQCAALASRNPAALG